MRWAAKLDEAIVIDDKGLRSLLKSETGPEDFCDAMCKRFEAEVRRQMEAGIPLMVELAPLKEKPHNPKAVKKIYGMTGGM
tara:strand:- start:810 stop:1052 length:243 start_codon:yes stop_codon:yes gene_type:complete